ncbi:MAG: hypoxanthine phosphoribosyltransferase, partial [Caldiserica bacterium]
PDIKEVILTEEKIRKRVKELAEEISEDYKNKVPVLISVLKGSVIFLSDLLRFMKINPKVDFIGVSSYQGKTQATGEVRLIMDLKDPIYGEDVIIIEDIVDTGLTLEYLRENLLTRKPSSLKVCVLLDKIEARKLDVPIDYRGFVIPNRFVVGYGLDYGERYRNLPYIGVLKEEVYKR